ncbi:LytTR family DNA-binding domain-containing protein [Subdoligranulum variabile]|uniref:LytTR family DNA-binding domain-containing protein n=1 Tax=Subdoligranulum variabile TaxID=214851 RepID=UPI0034E97CE3
MPWPSAVPAARRWSWSAAVSRYRCRCPRWCTSKATAGTSTCTCRGRDHLVTHTTLAQLEELLAEQGFLRLHKSYLVNMAFLDTLQSTGARLTDGTLLPVSSRTYRASKQRFLAWKGRQIC